MVNLLSTFVLGFCNEEFIHYFMLQLLQIMIANIDTQRIHRQNEFMPFGQTLDTNGFQLNLVLLSGLMLSLT
jgi:hypothetical protein